MIEIKKIFGLLLIGMCFYFLNMIVPWYILIVLITSTTIVAGMWYLAQPTYSSGMKRFNNVIGITCIAASMILALESYKAYVSRNTCSISNTIWITDYLCAQEKATHEQKPLLIKIGGPCCSLCTAIDNKHFADTQVLDTLEKKYVCVKVDASQETDVMTELKNHYTILGVPTIIVINPHNKEMIKKWQGELYLISPERFDMLLRDIVQAY